MNSRLSRRSNRIGDPKYADVVQRLTRRLEEWDHECPHMEPQFSQAAEQRDPRRVRQIRAAFAKWSSANSARVARP